jgi:predicted ferric reductase
MFHQVCGFPLFLEALKSTISNSYILLTVIFLLLAVSKREWHPFSLCNGTKKGSADVIVRSHGKDSWTGRLVQLAGGAPIRAYTSGTYGSVPCMAASDVAVYIAGGTSITGFLTVHCV